MKNIINTLSIFFIILGLLTFCTLVHELVHIYQMEDPMSICWDFQQDSVMHVTADAKDVISAKESTAYIISILVMSLVAAFIFSKGFSIWK